MQQKCIYSRIIEFFKLIYWFHCFQFRMDGDYTKEVYNSYLSLISSCLAGEITACAFHSQKTGLQFGNATSYLNLEKLGEGTYATVYKGISRLVVICRYSQKHSKQCNSQNSLRCCQREIFIQRQDECFMAVFSQQAHYSDTPPLALFFCIIDSK